MDIEMFQTISKDAERSADHENHIDFSSNVGDRLVLKICDLQEIGRFTKNDTARSTANKF